MSDNLTSIESISLLAMQAIERLSIKYSGDFERQFVEIDRLKAYIEVLYAEIRAAAEEDYRVKEEQSQKEYESCVKERVSK